WPSGGRDVVGGRCEGSCGGGRSVGAIAIPEINCGENRLPLTELSNLEMFAEGQGLLLIGRAETDAIEPIGYVEHPIIDDLEKGLTVVNEERHVVRTHLEHDLSAFELAIRPVTEARIEKASVMRTQLSTGRFIGHHLGGIVWRHADPFLGGEDVEFLRFEKQTVLAMPVQWL